MITFTKTANSVKADIGSVDSYFLRPDAVIFTRSAENKIYLQNEAAPNLKSYISFTPTEVKQ